MRCYLSKGEKILLRLIGTGPTLDECCKDYVYQEHNLDSIISFEKEINHRTSEYFYIMKIDLFVMPSYYEALGCVYLESMGY